MRNTLREVSVLWDVRLKLFHCKSKFLKISSKFFIYLDVILVKNKSSPYFLRKKVSKSFPQFLWTS